MSLHDFILDKEVPIRLTFFFGIFFVMALWEIMSPQRQLTQPKMNRWVNNITLVFLNSLLLRIIFPAAAVGMAIFVNENQWGIFNYYQLPLYLTISLSIIALDLIIYLQHVMVHAVPLLWRLHRVHHADLDYDVTTGARFHPIEIIISMLLKFAAIIILGAPVIAVLLFEIILNALAMFNHANIRIPVSIDNLLRWFIVTPDMHRVHHSVEDDETNSNFGFNLSLWDRIFGTYRHQPRNGQTGMTVGIHYFRDNKQTNQLPGMLTLPFKGKVTEYAINTRYWQAPSTESDNKNSNNKK